MTWFKADDGLYEHPKVLDLEERFPELFSEAMCLWVIAGTYSARNLTDGVIVRARLHRLVPFDPSAAADALVAVGMWVRVDSGYAFHDWLTYQPSREEVLAKREEERERKADQRARRKNRPEHVPGGQSPDVQAMSQRDNHGTHAGRPLDVPTLSQPCPVLPDPDPDPDPPLPSVEVDPARALEAPIAAPRSVPTEPPPTTRSKLLRAFRDRWEREHRALWPGPKGDARVDVFVRWIDSMAVRESLTADAVIERVLSNWWVDPWVERCSTPHPWNHLVTQFEGYFQTRPGPKRAHGPAKPRTAAEFAAEIREKGAESYEF